MMTRATIPPGAPGNADPTPAAAPDRPVPLSPIPADPMPVRPDEPDPLDCCGEGCVRCVYDVHDEAMERYEAQLAAWRKRHPGLSHTDRA